MLHILALVAALTVASTPAPGRRPGSAGVVRAPANRAAMARIPAGAYQSLYGPTSDHRVRVAAFSLDRRPVSQGDFLGFVRANAAWRRSLVSPTLVERGYLDGWRGDLELGASTDVHRPVTAVSWFAAKAYCAAQGKRLPTLHEWEYAAAASETRADATRDPKFVNRLLALYAGRASGGVLAPIGSGFRNVYGVRDLHGLAWEWTLDYNNVQVADASLASGIGAGSQRHAIGCASAAIGASDPTNYPAFMRSAFRAGLTGRSVVRTLGFRCASGVAVTS